MQIFSKTFFTALFFFLIQYLQRTCKRHIQCDAIPLDKSLTYLLFLLFQFFRGHANAIPRVMQLSQKYYSQNCSFFPNSVPTEDMRGPYPVWCNFLESTFHRLVLFPNSLPTEDMRLPYSLWCNNSPKKVLHTCCFSFFSFYRGNVNAILSAMQFFSKVLFTDLLFFLIEFLQRTCNGHN